MEPMDMDDNDHAGGPYSCYLRTPCGPYRTPGISQPTASPDSRPGSPASRSDVSDIDIDSQSPVAGRDAQLSPSLEHTWCSAMVLKSSSQHSEQTSDAKTKCSPGLNFGMFNKTCEPAATTVKTALVLKKSVMPRYGIPDDDMFFQSPGHSDKDSEQGTRNVIRRRQKVKPSASAPSLISAPTENLDNCSTWKHLFCRMFYIFLGVSIAICATVYLFDVQKRRCKLSRQFDKESVKIDMMSLVFGQHIATSLIPDMLDDYFMHLNSVDRPSKLYNDNLDLCKPLVFSFHGGTGVGKNFVSKIIADNLPHSKVTNYIVPLHFMHESQDEMHRDQIQQWIVGNITKCAVNIIVIDEMDKKNSGLVSGIINTIQKLTESCSSAAPIIFLLLSNSKAAEINRTFKELRKSQSLSRIEMTEFNFHTIFDDNDEWYSKFSENKKLIDAFVPFLPLEKQHVHQCIRRELVARKFSSSRDVVDKIAHELNFLNMGDLDLSITGCKRVADKVDYVMMNLL